MGCATDLPRPYFQHGFDGNCLGGRSVPDVAADAYAETRTMLSFYFIHLFSGSPLVEDGSLMTVAQMLRRCLELASGMAKLEPHACKMRLLN